MHIEENKPPKESHAARVVLVKNTIAENNLFSLNERLIHRLAELGIPQRNGKVTKPDNLTHSIAVSNKIGKIIKIAEKKNLYPCLIGNKKTAKSAKTAGLIHDVGKAGPPGYFFQQNENPFVKFFNIDFDENETPPSRTLFITALGYAVDNEYITLNEAYLLAHAVKESGKNPEKITLRDFYNLHSIWTLADIKREKLPNSVKIAAACHHISRGVVPGGYSEEKIINSGAYYVEIMDKISAIHERKNHYPDEIEIRQIVEMVRKSIRRECAFPLIKTVYGEFIDMMDENVVFEEAFNGKE